MLTRFCFGFYLALVLQVKCNNLYVDPQTEYITGGKIAVSCISIFDGPVTTGNAIEWIEMKSLSIISNHPESRVRRDGHRLLFDSTKYSDKGLYCCRLSKRSPSADHGCTYNSTVKIMAIESRTVTAAPQHSDARHNVVIKSTTTGTWKLKASPPERSISLGLSASINCLNETNNRRTFAQNIRWYKMHNNGSYEPIPNSQNGKLFSDAHQLRLFKVTVEDQGLYCCKPSIEASCSSSAVVNITVSLPPRLSPLHNRTVLVGETVVINCTVTMGEPNTILWQKYGNDLTDQAKHSIARSRNNNNTTLTITNVTKEDQGYYSCIARNKKYQKDNQSLYLHVKSQNSSVTCEMINTSYPISIRLLSYAKSCSIIETSTLHSVTNKFLQSVCNCSQIDYCITLSDVNCSLDDTTVTFIITLKEKQPMSLQNLIYSILQRGQVRVEFKEESYNMSCGSNGPCNEILSSTPIAATPRITPRITPSTTTTINASGTSQITQNNTNTTILAVTISTVVIIVMLIMLVIIVILAILLWSHKRKPNTKNEPNSPTTFQLTGNNNEHPSTSSSESGFHSSSESNESGSPVSITADHPFPPPTIQQRDNSDNSNSNATIRASVPVFNSSVTPLYTKQHQVIKTNKINTKPKCRHNLQLNNGPPNIRWSQNETYISHVPANIITSKPLPPVPKPSVTKEVKTNYYDDIVSFSGSTRRATRPTRSLNRSCHPQPVGNNHTASSSAVYANVTINGTGVKSPPMTYHKNVSLSQV